MITKELLISDFDNSLFQAMFKKYFAELEISVGDWEGVFSEMNTQNGSNLAYIRLSGNESVGFIQFTFITLENWFFKEKLGFIREFWVDEKFRKQGHGGELPSLAEKYFRDRGIHRIILTPDENEQRFYFNRGYSICEYIEAKNDMAVAVKEI